MNVFSALVMKDIVAFLMQTRSCPLAGTLAEKIAKCFYEAKLLVKSIRGLDLIQCLVTNPVIFRMFLLQRSSTC